MEHEAIKQYLSKFGYEFDMGDAVLAEHLRREMGNRLYEKYSRINPDQSDNLLETFRQANLACSFQASTLLDVYEMIVDRVGALALDNSVVVDLGCFTGALTSLLKYTNPSCTVFGVDKLKKVLHEGNANKVGDYQLLHWDYTKPFRGKIAQPDLLLCSLGVPIADTNAPKAIDIALLEASEFHRKTRLQISKFASAWASIARNGTRLMVVLRLGGVEVFLGAIDGIITSGWLPDYTGFGTIRCTDGQVLPLMQFTFTPGVQFDSGAAIDWWIKLHAQTSKRDGEFEGDAALEQVLLYMRAPNHCILSYETLPVDPVIGIQQGSVDQLYYVLIRSTQGHTGIHTWTNAPNRTAVDLLIAEKLNVSLNTLAQLRSLSKSSRNLP
jgi:hypothetical protein